MLYIQSDHLELPNENVGAQFFAPGFGDQNKSKSSSKNSRAFCALSARYLIKKRNFDNKEKRTLLNPLKPKDDTWNMNDV
jgi:hypothetical protein